MDTFGEEDENKDYQSSTVAPMLSPKARLRFEDTLCVNKAMHGYLARQRIVNKKRKRRPTLALKVSTVYELLDDYD